jgi:hypothetical protein
MVTKRISHAFARSGVWAKVVVGHAAQLQVLDFPTIGNFFHVLLQRSQTVPEAQFLKNLCTDIAQAKIPSMANDRLHRERSGALPNHANFQWKAGQYSTKSYVIRCTPLSLSIALTCPCMHLNTLVSTSLPRTGVQRVGENWRPGNGWYGMYYDTGAVKQARLSFISWCCFGCPPRAKVRPNRRRSISERISCSGCRRGMFVRLGHGRTAIRTLCATSIVSCLIVSRSL